jgi:hypothetical protein
MIRHFSHIFLVEGLTFIICSKLVWARNRNANLTGCELDVGGRNQATVKPNPET